MLVSLEVLAAIAVMVAVVWGRVFASWGKWRVPATAAVVLLVAAVLADELGWFAAYRNETTEAQTAGRPASNGGSRPVPAPQPLPSDWTITYRMSGGIAGESRLLTVTRAGDLIAEERRFGQRAAGRAAPELMDRLDAFLRTARPAAPEPESPIRDGLNFSLTFSANGQARDLELSREMTALLDEALTRTLRDALLGSWQQSAWKLCRPVPSLAQIEPQITRLELAADGRYSVRWGTSGAHPEQHGRYRADPFRGTIGFELESPAAARDFSGNGRVRIDMDELRLEQVWFATVLAETKPDICELTFRRIGDQAP